MIKKNSKESACFQKCHGGIAGFTLIEILVAASLITLSVFAVVSVVNTGSLLERGDNNRRQAKAVIRSVFEQQYDFRDYNTIPVNTTKSETVLIDERGGNPMNGTLTTKIDADTISHNTNAVSGKRVSITCAWVEPDGIGDSITLVKLLASAQ